MGLGQRLNRKLENAVGNTFARVFGGSVVPQELAQALLREATSESLAELATFACAVGSRVVERLGHRTPVPRTPVPRIA